MRRVCYFTSTPVDIPTDRDRGIVRTMASYGVPLAAAAAALGTNTDDLIRQFPQEVLATRPTKTLTTEVRLRVDVLASYGVLPEDIARVVDIPLVVLLKECQRELETAATEASAAVAERVLAQAKDGDLKAATFWLERRAGWHAKTDMRVAVEHREQQPGMLHADLLALLPTDDLRTLKRIMADLGLLRDDQQRRRLLTVTVGPGSSDEDAG